MPAKLTKLPSGRVRVLNAIDHGFKPTRTKKGR